MEVASCTPAELRRLLFNLAVVFGFIHVTASRSSEAGKSNVDELKMRFRDDSEYHEFSRDKNMQKTLDTRYQQVGVVVCDMDNTLFDFVEARS